MRMHYVKCTQISGGKVCDEPLWINLASPSVYGLIEEKDRTKIMMADGSFYSVRETPAQLLAATATSDAAALSSGLALALPFAM